MQERLESSRAGRALISAFLVATVLAIGVSNLPESEIRRQAGRVTDPYVNAVGLNQNWSVFAPDPRRQVVELRARVLYPGGKTRIWRVPRGNRFFGAYWDYRWHKWSEGVTAGNNKLWAPAARWILRREQAERRDPFAVALVVRSYELRPPGAGPARGPWRESEFYDLALGFPAGDE